MFGSLSTLLLLVVAATVALSPHGRATPIAAALSPRGVPAVPDALSPRRVPPVVDAGSSIRQTGWQSGKSLADCNRYMLDSQLATDVTFQVAFRLVLVEYGLLANVGC